MTDYTGKKVIVRSHGAGVFFGTLKEFDAANGIVELTNCRRVWYWSGAASLSQLACDGVKNARDSKITQEVASICVTQVLEIIPCTGEAIENLNLVPVWKM